MALKFKMPEAFEAAPDSVVNAKTTMKFTSSVPFEEEPQAPHERRRGVGRAPMPIGTGVTPVPEFALRAAGRLAGKTISTGAALRNLVTTGWREPIKFGPGDINKRMEDAFILSEASAFDRFAEKTVDYAIFPAMAAGATALVAPLLPAAAPAWLAGSVGLAGISLLDLRQEEITTGQDISALSYGAEAGISAALGPVGHYIGKAGVAVVQKMLGRELGRTAKALVQNTALGTAFGGYSAATTDEKWYVEMPAAWLGFNLSNVHSTLFSGKYRPRTEAEARKTVELSAEVLEKVKPGEPKPTLFGEDESSRVMAKVRGAQATVSHTNAQADEALRTWDLKKKTPSLKERVAAREEEVRTFIRETSEKAAARAEEEIQTKKLEADSIEARKLRLRSFGIQPDEIDRIVAGRPKERISPEAREATAQRLAIDHQIPIEEARTIAARRLTERELTEALLDKTEEALLLEAERRGQAVLDEVKYRLGVMDPAHRRLYEARRQTFTPDEKEFLASRIPSAPEARAREAEIEADVRSMEEEMRAPELPQRLEARQRAAEQVAGLPGRAAGGRLRTETPQGEVAPESPAERVRRALVERGVATAPEEPVSRVARVSKKAAGQAETQARISRRQEQQNRQRQQQLREDQQRMMAESKRRILEERALRQARSQAARPVERPAPAPPPPSGLPDEALPVLERDLGGRANRVAPGAEKAPTEPKARQAPGAPISNPSEATVGQAMSGPTQVPGSSSVPPAGGRVESAVSQAQAMLGERAVQTPPAPEPKSKKERKVLREIEDGLDRTRAQLESEARAVNSLRPRISAKEAGEKLLQVAPWVAAGLGLTGQLLTDDDEKRSQIAAITGAAIFPLLGRGTRFSAPQKWAASEVERDAGLRRLVEKAEELIYRPNSRMNHTRVQEIEAELAAILEKIPERETWRWDPRQRDIFVTTVGHRLSRMGQAGAMLNRLAQDMMTVSQQKIGAWKYRARNVPTEGQDPHPDVELSGSQKELMNQYIESKFIPGAASPDIQKIEPRTRLRIAQVLLEQFDVEVGEPATKKAARALRDFYDDFYSAIEVESLRNIMGFSPLKIENGRYRQHRFRDEVFYPPDWMRDVRPAEWKRRFDTAERYHKLIADDTGLPIETVKAALRGMRRSNSASPFNRGLLDLELRKSTNLDYHLVLKTRIGRDWDPAAGFNQYLEGTVRRLEYSKRFGKNGEIATRLLDALEKDGWSRYMATKFFDAATLQNTEITGVVGRISAKAVRELSSAVSFSKLGSFAISQMPQMAALVSQGEFPSSPREVASRVKDTVRGIKASIEQSRVLPESYKGHYGDKLAAQFVANAGIVTEAVHVDMLTRMGGLFPRVLAGYIRFFGGQIDRLWRNVGGLMGDTYFQKVFEEYKWAKKRGDAKELEKAQFKFAELFDEPVHRQMAEKGEAIAPEEFEFLRYVAASTFSNRTQYRSLPIDMPLLAADPLGRTFYALATFNLRATANFNRQLALAWREPRTRARIIAAWALMTGSGVAWLQVQRARRHDKFDPDEDSVLQEIMEGSAYGSLGVGYYDGFRDLTAEYGNPVVSLQGPVWGEAYEFGDAVSRARKAGKVDPLLKFMIRRLPWTPATLIPGVPTPPELAEKAFPKKRTGSAIGVRMRPLSSRAKPKKKKFLKRVEDRLVDIIR